MRVDDHDDPAALFFNLRVHVTNLCICEVLGVELEILIAIRVIVLLSPLNIGPKHINREAIISELPISIHEHIRGNWGPLAEMEAKSVQKWHWRKSRDRGKIFIDLFDALFFVTTREHEEFNDIGLACKGHLRPLILAFVLTSVDIHCCLRRVHPEEGGRRVVRQAHNVRDGAVKGPRLIRSMQMVRGINLIWISASCSFEGQGVLTLWNTEEGLLFTGQPEAPRDRLLDGIRILAVNIDAASLLGAISQGSETGVVIVRGSAFVTVFEIGRIGRP